MMDGELRVEQGGVEAGPDAGTTFGFTILAEALPGGVGTTLLTLEAMRVLVIAADPTEKRVLALQVEQWGASAPPATPAEARVVEPGALRVLVADDNALNQNLLKRLVVKLGHTVDVVATGREAVQAVAQQPYDAVLMDVLMPEMDGLAAAEAICRRWPRGNRPRLIALTAMAGPGDQERCLRAGFDDYMSKPVRMEDLTESLKSAVGYRTIKERSGL